MMHNFFNTLRWAQKGAIALLVQDFYREIIRTDDSC